MSVSSIILAASEASSGIAPGTGGACGVNDATGVDFPCLPVIRWATAAGMFQTRSEFSKYLDMNMWEGVLPNNLTGLLTTAGNGSWAVAGFMTLGFDPEDSKFARFGFMVNRVVGILYHAMFSTGIFIALPFITTLLVGIFAAYRGQGFGVLARRFMAVVVGLSLFFVMGVTSYNSTAGVQYDPSKDAAPTPAMGTPWWVVNQATILINRASSGLNGEILDGMKSSGTFVSDRDGGRKNLMSCQRYIGVLDEHANDRASGNALSQSVNTLWEETGLRVWMRAAYGSGNDSLDIFCRILEYRTGVDGEDMSTLTEESMTPEADVTLDPYAIGFQPLQNTTSSSIGVFDVIGDIVTFHPLKAVDKLTAAPLSNTTSARLDRWLMLYNACKVNRDDKKWDGRNGFRFLTALAGDDRKDVGAEGHTYNETKNSEERIDTACEAAFTGKVDGKSYSTVDGDKYVNDGKQRERISKLVHFFEVSPTNDNWQDVVTQFGGGNEEQNIQARNLIDNMRGNGSISDVFAAFLFLLSGIMALAIWGFLFGFARNIAVILSILMGLGLFLAAFVYALSPERGQQMMKTVGIRILGLIIGPTLMALIGSFGALFVNLVLLFVGAIGTSGGTSANLTLLAFLVLILPPIYLKFLQWLCIDILRIGDPLSVGGLKQVMGVGKAIGNGLKVAAGAFVGGAIAVATGGTGMGVAAAVMQGAAAGATARGGVSGMLSAARHGASIGGAQSRYGMGGTAGSSRQAGPSVADAAATAQQQPDGQGQQPQPDGQGQVPPTGRPEGQTPTPENPDAGGRPVSPEVEAAGRRLEDAELAGRAADEAGDDPAARAAWLGRHDQAGAADDAAKAAERLDKMSASEAYELMANQGQTRLRMPEWMSKTGHAVGGFAAGLGSKIGSGVSSARSWVGDRMHDAGSKAGQVRDKFMATGVGRRLSDMGGAARHAAERVSERAGGWIASRTPGAATAMQLGGMPDASAPLPGRAERGYVAQRAAELRDRAGAAFARVQKAAAITAGNANSRVAHWLDSNKLTRGRFTTMSVNQANVSRMADSMGYGMGVSTGSTRVDVNHNPIGPDAGGTARAAVEAASRAGWSGLEGSAPTARQQARIAEAMAAAPHTVAPNAGAAGSGLDATLTDFSRKPEWDSRTPQRLRAQQEARARQAQPAPTRRMPPVQPNVAPTQQMPPVQPTQQMPPVQSQPAPTRRTPPVQPVAGSGPARPTRPAGGASTKPADGTWTVDSNGMPMHVSEAEQRANGGKPALDIDHPENNARRDAGPRFDDEHRRGDEKAQMYRAFTDFDLPKDNGKAKHGDEKRRREMIRDIEAGKLHGLTVRDGKVYDARGKRVA